MDIVVGITGYPSFFLLLFDDNPSQKIDLLELWKEPARVQSKTREFNFTEIQRESIGMTGLLSLDLLFPIGTSHFPDPFGATNIISLSMLGLYGLLSIGLYKERAKISAKLLGTDFQICLSQISD